MCDEEEKVMKKEIVVEERYCYEKEIELTIHKTSMFSHGDGFLVYDSKGDIIFRVDSYAPIKHRLLLMDSFGKPLLTLLPKRPTLHRRWEGFLGEKLSDQHQSPIFCIWKSTMIGRSNVMVEVHNKPHGRYHIEGCFSERRCSIYHAPSDDDTSKISVAEIKRKVEPTKKIVLGREVFSLILKAGFDAAFAMGLVLALDRIHGDDVNCHMDCHKDIGT
ncbi:protein LURP-one-related 12-like [Amaranthus tricolor]|uniref:protein LURP-one-related 12-like n=1 Tax=Amaranthus tricolor TaxID=29722 RepID=UPI0025899C8A|nr:protein LURP-one-related 12-like [Amaranthus tricolor]